MTYKSWLIAALVMCGCGDDDSGDPGTIELCAGDATFAAYRDGSGPWQSLTANAQGAYILRVSDDYEYVIVREQTSGYVFSYASRSTRSETLAQLAGRQTSCTPPGGQMFTVSGELAQAGDVAMDSRSAGVAAPGPFTLDVRPGTHDLWATTGNVLATGGKVLLRKDQSITANTTLPPIDIDTEGSDLVTVPLTVSGFTSTESPTTFVYLLDKRDYDFVFASDRTGVSAAVVPATLVGTNYEQWISVSSASRGVDFLYSGGTPSAELLPALTGVTFARGDGISATWSALPVSSYSSAQLSVSGETPTKQLYQFIYATSGWLEKHGATSVSFDSTAPGFNPAWKLDTTKQFDATFTVWVDDGDVERSTSATTNETQTPRRIPPGVSPLDAERVLQAAQR
jgi:hypothetical protein